MIKTKHLVVKKKNGSEPTRHLKEPYIPDFTEHTNKGYAAAEEEPFVLKQRPKLYPLSWGWNADGRAGNATAVEIRQPQIAHKSAMRNYVQGDAGTHHSLLVSETGIVYSFGNGRKGQLGYSNEFMVQPGVKGPKGGRQQTCPRRVTPTGNIFFGTDIKVAQVAAGRFFSISRQLSINEGMNTVQGLHESAKALAALRKTYPDSVTLQKAWCEVRQEKQKIGRISRGQLMSWGTGGHGELGQGWYHQYMCKPTLIDRLRGTSIIQVSAGRHHVLAISSDFKLFSWGSGKAGKLGHGNFEDVHSPENVSFFDKYYVESCAAGDNHSAVLTRTRKGDRETQLRRVACFGKGAHGRLGNNHNYTQTLPVLVDIWPPSLHRGIQIHQVACGGAHTLALCYRPVNKCLANPWGRETYVAAWGYGANGQLGNGYTKDSFTPLKVRMPERCTLICEVAAGRSWSMARTIGGELYTWGKGLRGQLGAGKAKYRLVPLKVKSFASFVGLSAGFGHNVCISTAKKLYNPAVSLQAKDFPDPFDNNIPMGLKQTESESLYRFDCCKRDIHPLRARMRFMCKECNITSVCIVCMRLCHVGHTITERLPVEKAAQQREAEAKLKKRKPKVHIDNERQEAMRLQRKIKKKNNKKKKKKRKGAADDEKPVLMVIKNNMSTIAYRAKFKKLMKTKIPYCQCGMFNSKCCLLPSIPEEEKDILDKDGDEIVRIDRIKNVSFDALPVAMRRQQAAIRIQRQAQWYIGRQNIKKLRQDMGDLRRVACTTYWKEKIMAPIWGKLDRAKGKFREGRERMEMEKEEDLKKKYDYLFAMQFAISAGNAMNYAMERWLGALSLAIPRVIRGKVATDEQDILATHAFSVASMRHQQMQLHPKKRISVKMLVVLTKNIPREHWREGQWRDWDLVAYTQRFVRNIQMERWRKQYREAVDAKIMAREKAVAAARAILTNLKLGGAAAVKKAEALMNKGSKNGAVKPESQAAKAARILKEKAAALKVLNKKVEDALKKDREPFDMFAPPKDQHVRIRRRNTVLNPQSMFKRIMNLRETIPQQQLARRRNSVPMKMSRLYCEQVPNYNSYAGSKQSLELYEKRFVILEEYIKPQYQNMWRNMEDRVKNKRIKRMCGYAWLNPRLPKEMRDMLSGNGRRRTIADPERLAAQMHIMFEVRNLFAQTRAKAAEVEKLRVRRRSFDLGEMKDEDDGILTVLGYEFEEPYKQPTLSELRRDSSIMENRMIFAGIAKQKEKSKVAAPDFSGFKVKETVQQRIDREVRESEERNANNKMSSDASRLERAQAAGNQKPRVRRGKNKQVVEEEDEVAVQAVIWHEYFSDLGETYYYNEITGESVWEFPTNADAQVMSQYQDEEGNYYWYNWTTGETVWA